MRRVTSGERRVVAYNENVRGTPEIVSFFGGDIVLPLAPAPITFSSTSAEDTIGGLGANRITIFAIDDNFDEVTLVADMDGLNTVTIDGLYWRINEAVVSLSGGADELSSNLGDITFEIGGNTLARIGTFDTGVPTTRILSSIFTVPRGHRMLAKSAIITSNGAADIKIYAVTKPVRSRANSTIVMVQDYAGEPLTFNFPEGFIQIDEQRDFFFAAVSSGQGASVSIEYINRMERIVR